MQSSPFLRCFVLALCTGAQTRYFMELPLDCSMPGSPVLHYLPEFAQTHIHWVGDAIQPSRPLSPHSPPALNLSQHQGLFQEVGSSHQRPKFWSFSFSISPFSEYSGLISFKIHLILCCCSHLLIWFANFLSGVTVPYIYRENLNHLWKFFFFPQTTDAWDLPHIN